MIRHTVAAFTAVTIAFTTTMTAVAENPVIRDRFTADPAALVHDGRVYLYTGHDEAKPEDKHFVMRDWRCYSSADLKTWTDHGSPLSLQSFAWAGSDAWAGQVIERGGKFYWFVTVRPRGQGFAIGVAVADSPLGPFADALGKPLISNDMTTGATNAEGREIDWDDLDPTVLIDDDQAYLFWGNTKCRYAKLKDNMTELDGPIVDVDLPRFTEAPWLHKHAGRYYLSYAYEYPEKIAYATADRITGPWTFSGVINELIPNSPTNHQSIIQFKGEWYFFYHTAALPGGGPFRRSVAAERLVHRPDGSIEPVTQTAEGLGAP